MSETTFEDDDGYVHHRVDGIVQVPPKQFHELGSKWRKEVHVFGQGTDCTRWVHKVTGEVWEYGKSYE